MTLRPPLVSLLVALTGCALLAPRPDPSRFFVLTPLAPADAPPPTVPLSAAIGLGPVTLPGYLRRPELAARVAPNQVEFSAFARWGEPLDANVTRVLARNLSLLLGTEHVVPFPWFGTLQPGQSVEVDVQQFERQADGTVRLVAGWHVHDARTHTVVAVHETSLTEPAAPDDPEAIVAALSRTLAGLAREIAAALRPHPPRR